MIPYETGYSKRDLEAVLEVLKSDPLISPKVPQFEELLSKTTYAQYATAVNSATSLFTLHVWLCKLIQTILFGLYEYFCRFYNCARYCIMDFVDIDPNTSNISISFEEEIA